MNIFKKIFGIKDYEPYKPTEEDLIEQETLEALRAKLVKLKVEKAELEKELEESNKFLAKHKDTLDILKRKNQSYNK